MNFYLIINKEEDGTMADQNNAGFGALKRANFLSKVKELQNEITEAMRELDPALELNEDSWERKDHEGNPGGGGITRAFQGEFFENAGVNTSEIFGAINPEFAKKLKGESNQLWAAGISLILHPRNPKIPTVHANFRMIQQGETFWFGGGADLTPFYPFEEDFIEFHQTWKNAAGENYGWMKKECDEYFVNKHREGEMRGIGGIFFDHYNTGDLDADFNMVTGLSDHFIPSYFPIASKRASEKYTEKTKTFNCIEEAGTLSLIFSMIEALFLALKQMEERTPF